jgi:hypothetical protein
MGDTDETKGLYQKFNVSRVSDPQSKHADCFYFVLDLDHDPLAIPALQAYADAARDRYPDLARDLDAEIASRCRKEPPNV